MKNDLQWSHFVSADIEITQLSGKFLEHNTLYYGEVITRKCETPYIGMTVETFKSKYNNRTKFFRQEKYEKLLNF